MPKKTKAVFDPKAAAIKVNAAIEELEGAGVAPTVKAIVEITGGSYRDMCEIIRTVKFEREERSREKAVVPEMPAEVREMTEALWIRAFKAADDTNAEAKMGFNQRIQALETENNDLRDVIGDLERERDAANAALATDEETITRLTGELDATAGALQAAQARLEERDAIIEMFRSLQRLEE